MDGSVEQHGQAGVRRSPLGRTARRKGFVNSVLSGNEEPKFADRDKPDALAKRLSNLPSNSNPVGSTFNSGSSIPHKDAIDAATLPQAPKTTATTGAFIFQNSNLKDSSTTSTEKPSAFPSSLTASTPSKSPQGKDVIQPTSLFSSPPFGSSSSSSAAGLFSFPASGPSSSPSAKVSTGGFGGFDTFGTFGSSLSTASTGSGKPSPGTAPKALFGGSG